MYILELLFKEDNIAKRYLFSYHIRLGRFKSVLSVNIFQNVIS